MINLRVLLATLLLSFITSGVLAKPPTDPRVLQVVKQSGLRYQIDGDGDVRLMMGLPGGRSQVVFINSNTSKIGDLEIREIWSVGFKLSSAPSPQIRAKMLSLNANYKVGFWSIKQVGPIHIGIFTVKLPPIISTDVMKTIVQVVSTTADSFERETLSSDDL